jgi:hypothetical protein
VKWLRFTLTAWAVVLLGAFALRCVLSPTKGVVLACLFLAVCFALALMTYRDIKAAWMLCLSIAGLAFLRFVPMVAYNVYLFVKQDPRYVDSPGTIFIVLVNAVLFVLPAMIVLILAIVHRRSVGRILFARSGLAT